MSADHHPDEHHPDIVTDDTVDDEVDHDGLLDETAPLPPPGGEQTTPSEGPDDLPAEGGTSRDRD
ncbi:hypothetical protein [Egicoccus sp. AB-alg6-2]|uniref:hypothetical protein n=1 Tax=Egicoccus sp. AB-alg6-2 TaxID=3242692 RepID=UPI00359E2D2C